jgi:hypothetical protein
MPRSVPIGNESLKGVIGGNHPATVSTAIYPMTPSDALKHEAIGFQGPDELPS